MKLSSKIKTALVAMVLTVVGASAVVANTSAVSCPCGVSADTYAECGMVCADPEHGQGDSKDLNKTVQNVINAVLYVVGILAVVMVIFGGVQYTTSGGDQAKVTKAKNTILYGVVGLVIAILAYAIVNFVVGEVTGK